jgi:hypothetical protein
MTVEEAKAKIFHWLCSRYHDPGKGNEYIDKDTVKYAIGIPEEVFEKAVKEFVDPGAHDCVEVEMPTLRLRLGTGGLDAPFPLLLLPLTTYLEGGFYNV